MSVVTLPLRNDLPHYTFQAELDGVTYGFELWWNDRAETWFMSLFTSDDLPIAVGLRVVVDWPLGIRCVDARMPPGVLIAQDTTGNRQDPDFAALGSRVLLLYFSKDELA